MINNNHSTEANNTTKQSKGLPLRRALHQAARALQHGRAALPAAGLLHVGLQLDDLEPGRHGGLTDGTITGFQTGPGQTGFSQKGHSSP